MAVGAEMLCDGDGRRGRRQGAAALVGAVWALAQPGGSEKAHMTEIWLDGSGRV